MRLFLSCNVQQDVADYVRSVAARLPEARLSVPKNIDLTIKFLGSVSPDRLGEIKKRLGRLKFTGFRAVLDGIGFFSGNIVRVVWIGLKPAEEFIRLHEQADGLLEPLFPGDSRFQPHITVARVKSVDDKKKFIEGLKKVSIEPMSWQVDRLVLFESRLDAAGARHVPVFEVPAQ